MSFLILLRAAKKTIHGNNHPIILYRLNRQREAAKPITKAFPEIIAIVSKYKIKNDNAFLAHAYQAVHFISCKNPPE